MCAMSAAEHLLLRDASEPVQGNVADRMAFLIGSGRTERQKIVSSFKRSYQLRSKYVHHLNDVEDEEALEDFFVFMWRMLFSAVAGMHRFGDHSTFLDEIDKVKFS